MNSKWGEILTQLKNCKKLELPKYEAEMHQLIREEVIAIVKATHQLQKQKNAPDVSLNEQEIIQGKQAILFDQIYRIKRFLMIYNETRLQKIQNQFWEYSGNLHPDEKDNLSEAELSYFAKYKNLVIDYQEDIKLDLYSDLEPPMETRVEMRVLKDCGVIINENGNQVTLNRNSGGFINLRLIENFVKQGFITVKKQ